MTEENFKEVQVNFVFVWIGRNLPQYAFKSLNFCIENNPNANVYLLVDTELNSEVEKKIRSEIIVYNVENVVQDELLKFQNLRVARSSFWLNTALRIAVLSIFGKNQQLKSMFHVELDNLVFSIDDLAKRLDRLGSGVFCVRDSPDNALANFFYVNDFDSLDEFISHLLIRDFDNEMQALASFFETSGAIFSLPSESEFTNSSFFKVESSKFIGGIFDGACLGQYLFGTDVNSLSSIRLGNRFVNKSCKINLNLARFEYDLIEKKFFIVFDGDRHRVFNLHVHSKFIGFAIAAIEKNDFLDRFNLGKPSFQLMFLKLCGYVVLSFDLRFFARARRSMFIKFRNKC